MGKGTYGGHEGTQGHRSMGIQGDSAPFSPSLGVPCSPIQPHHQVGVGGAQAQGAALPHQYPPPFPRGHRCILPCTSMHQYSAVQHAACPAWVFPVWPSVLSGSSSTAESLHCTAQHHPDITRYITVPHSMAQPHPVTALDHPSMAQSNPVPSIMTQDFSTLCLWTSSAFHYTPVYPFSHNMAQLPTPCSLGPSQFGPL